MPTTPLQLLVEAFHQARRGEIEEVVLVMRRPSGGLQLAMSSMPRSHVAEHAKRLDSFAGELVGRDKVLDEPHDGNRDAHYARVLEPEELE